MKIVIAPDSFKSTFTALEASRLISEGFRTIFPEAELTKIPVADGGEGTLDALIGGLSGSYIDTTVKGPLGVERGARFGIIPEKTTAVVEMAEASGLIHLGRDERNPLLTSTYGTGELIRRAARENVTRILVGAGGSATVDCGCGAAQALGIDFLDDSGQSMETPFKGVHLEAVGAVDVSDRVFEPDSIKLEVACDVNNPLTGPDGAARIYGPQKGADPAAVSVLERGLERVCRVIERDLGLSVGDLPGGGAAGGLAAGLFAFFGAELVNGFHLVAGMTDFEEQLRDASLVVTGEGRIDNQTLQGKAPAGVIGTANKMGLPVIVIAGSLGEFTEMDSLQVKRVFTIIKTNTQTTENETRASGSKMIKTSIHAAEWCRKHIFNI